MTITPGTLISNTQSIASSAGGAYLALAASLKAFAKASYDLDKDAFGMAKDIADDDIEVSDVFSDMADTIRDSAEFDPYPGVSGSPQAPGNTQSVYDALLSALNSAFPSEDAVSVKGVLDDLVDSEAGLLLQAKAVADVRDALVSNVVGSVNGLFSSVTPFPVGADQAAQSYAGGYASAEIGFVSSIDVAEDYVNTIRFATAKKRAVAGYISAMLRAKYDVLGTIRDYLDSLSSARKAAIEASKKADDLAISGYESEIDVVAATNQLKGAIARAAARYYAAQASAMAEVNSLKAAAVGVAAGEFALVSKIMSDTGGMTSDVAASEASAAARRASAAVAALGTVISSAVTSFG